MSLKYTDNVLSAKANPEAKIANRTLIKITTGNHGKALRNQKIEPVTVADFDHVVFEAEAFNVLFENDLHIKMRLDA